MCKKLGAKLVQALPMKTLSLVQKQELLVNVHGITLVAGYFHYNEHSK